MVVRRRFGPEERFDVALRSMFAAVPWWLWAIQLITMGLTQMLYFVLMTGVAGDTILSIGGGLRQCPAGGLLHSVRCVQHTRDEALGHAALLMNTPPLRSSS